MINGCTLTDSSVILFTSSRVVTARKAFTLPHPNLKSGPGFPKSSAVFKRQALSLVAVQHLLHHLIPGMHGVIV